MKSFVSCRLVVSGAIVWPSSDERKSVDETLSEVKILAAAPIIDERNSTITKVKTVGLHTMPSVRTS